MFAKKVVSYQSPSAYEYNHSFVSLDGNRKPRRCKRQNFCDEELREAKETISRLNAHISRFKGRFGLQQGVNLLSVIVLAGYLEKISVLLLVIFAFIRKSSEFIFQTKLK